MTGFIQIYYEDKFNFERFLLGDEKFRNIKGNFNIHSKEISYPLFAKYKSLTYKLDLYRGYILGSLPYFYSESKNIKFIWNLNFHQLSESIDMLEKNTVDIEKSRISKMYFGLRIRTSSNTTQIIKNNILMFNLRGFNQDKIGTPKKELKQFEYDDFILGVYSSKEDNYKIKNYLRIELRFTSAKKLRDIGIKNIKDLKNKEKLRGLISMFFKRFDELTIVDCFSYDQFSTKEKEKMKLYMNVNYWQSFQSADKYRKAKSRARKDFELIQRKHNLNTLKNEIKNSLEREFKNLLEN